MKKASAFFTKLCRKIRKKLVVFDTKAEGIFPLDKNAEDRLRCKVYKVSLPWYNRKNNREDTLYE